MPRARKSDSFSPALVDIEDDDAPAGTLAERIRDHLARDIATGRLEPGLRLDENEIAAKFSVSRTPVREAFRLLAANDMVDLRGRQGASVRRINASTVIEMFQVMAELEGLCARLAARRVTPSLRVEIEAIHERLRSASLGESVDAFYDINQEFHEAIYEAAGSRYLREQTRRLRNQTAAYRRRVTFLPNRFASTIAEHEQVMAAIFTHDAALAHDRMRDHVNLLSDDMRDFLASFGD